MPDNWNILASLLGTPKPPDRPAVKEEPAKPAAEPEPVAETAESKEAEPDAVAPEPKETSEPSAKKVSAFSEPDEGADDVLQALAAVKPPPKLPGFGISDDDADESGDESDDTPSGFGAAESKISKRETQLKSGGDESPGSKRDRKHRGDPDLGEP
ncbi:MAG: hypothetical protein ABJE27_04475, partial [Rhodopirellula bahusiensis]